MISRENIKYYIFIAFISILIYKILDSPYRFIDRIGDLVSFFSPFLLGILLTLLIKSYDDVF